jgi:DNA-binding HxlR family transcriptional regulator
MQRASFLEMNCSIAQTLEVIGEWWTPLILRDAMWGVTRFEEFQQRLGIARNILSKRLDRLVEEGVMERRTYDEGRQRHDYRLTEKGQDLWAVLVLMRQWGDKWIAGKGNESTLLRHTECGNIASAVLVCESCGKELERQALVPVAGPGLRDPDLLPAHLHATTA